MVSPLRGGRKIGRGRYSAEFAEIVNKVSLICIALLCGNSAQVNLSSAGNRIDHPLSEISSLPIDLGQHGFGLRAHLLQPDHLAYCDCLFQFGDCSLCIPASKGDPRG